MGLSVLSAAVFQGTEKVCVVCTGWCMYSHCGIIFSTWKLLMWAYIAVCFGMVLWVSWLHMHQLCEKFGKEVCSAASSAYLCLGSGSSNAGIISMWGAESPLADHMYCYCLLAVPDTNCYHVVCRAFISIQIKKTWGCSGVTSPCLISCLCCFTPKEFWVPFAHRVIHHFFHVSLQLFLCCRMHKEVGVTLTCPL